MICIVVSILAKLLELCFCLVVVILMVNGYGIGTEGCDKIGLMRERKKCRFIKTR